jgi:hypothetical protein
MTTVFLGGSRHVSRLNDDVRGRIDTIIKKGFPIVVGDANGADKALQAYLKSRKYRNVQVYCSGGRCRNNLGGWVVQAVQTQLSDPSFDFYSVKDRAMADVANVGFMVWDGKSVGTLCNVLRLLKQKKKAALYAVPEKAFHELKTARDWSEFIRHCARDVRRKLEQRFEIADTTNRPEPAQLSLVGHR